MEAVQEKFTAYLAAHVEGASNLSIDRFERIYGGASRETYRVHFSYVQGGDTISNRVILRLDPKNSLVETENIVEYNAYSAFHGTAVPVPEPKFIEQDASHLGGAFFVMEEIEGCEASFYALGQEPYMSVKEKIGEASAIILGEIAKTDPADVGLSGKLDPVKPGDAWKKELTYWENAIDKDELTPQPIVRAAIRWLKKNPPPAPEKICVVHGDYRAGNFLFNESGEIRAILDWEMCHLGDPLEDVAYGMNNLWSFADPNKVGGLISREKFIELWENTSGLKLDPGALKWWEIFTCVKSVSIWINAAKKYSDGSNTDMILGHTGLVATNIQNFIILNKMEKLS